MFEHDKIEARWNDGWNDNRETVVNPGDWYGKVFLFWNEDCFSPPVFPVEARSWESAYEAFTESDQGYNILRIDPEDLEDYREETEDGEDGEEPQYSDRIIWTGNGPIDTESVNGREAPSSLRYHGRNLPPWGIDPARYDLWYRSVEDGYSDGRESRWRSVAFNPTRNEPSNDPEGVTLSRIAYCLGFLSGSPCDRQARKARLYLRLAGIPFF